MLIKPIALLAVLCGAAACGYAALRTPPQLSAPVASDRSQPAVKSFATDSVRSSNLRIEHYSAGSCATLSIEGHATPILDSCHGWSITDCGGTLLVRSAGVRLDEATILSAPANKNRWNIMNLRHLLEESLKRSAGAPYEYLHLRILEPQCGSIDSSMAFEGSVIRIGATGSAAPVKGVVRIARDGTNSVTFQ